MEIYIKQDGLNQFYAVDCVIIRTRNGNIRVLPLSIEEISSRKYYRQDESRRIILPVFFSGDNEKFFANDDVFIQGTPEYNFFDSIAKSTR